MKTNLKEVFQPKLFGLFKKGKYDSKKFTSDLIAGIIVGIIALPLAIAFGIASGVTPQQGLITAIVAGFLISFFGGSNFLIGGPTGAFIVIVAGIVGQYGMQGLIIATIMAGVFLILMGVFKMGVIFKFIPYPIVVGFTSGIALTIFSTQMKDFFGFPLDLEVPAGFIPQWICYFKNIGSIDWVRDLIWHLPASDLLGVGRATEKLLGSYAIRTIGDLANAYPDLIQRKLGKNGMVLLAFANGLDRSRVAKQDYEPPMKSVGHGITTMQDLENNAEVWRIMLALTQDIGKKLRLYNKNAGGVAIYIRYVQDKQIAGKQWQCQLPMRTHSAAIIAREAYGLFERNYRWEYPVRSVTVRAINLCSQDEPEQIGFFMNPQEVDRRERLETAIEEIRDRFGKYAIQPACLCQQIKMPTDREIELRMPTGLFN